MLASWHDLVQCKVVHQISSSAGLWPHGPDTVSLRPSARLLRPDDHTCITSRLLLASWENTWLILCRPKRSKGWWLPGQLENFKFRVIFKFPAGTWLVCPAAGGGKAGLHIACDIGKVILRHPYIPMLYSMSYKTSKKFAFDIRISRYWTSISYNDIAVLTTISKKKLRYR